MHDQKTVKIIQISAISFDEFNRNEVFGLSDNECVYLWNSKKAEWEMYITK